MQRTNVTLVGNLTSDPMMKTAESKERYTRFRIACTPRSFNRNINQWVDGTTSFYTITCWRQLAWNVAESLHKGQQVIVSGELTVREYQTVDSQGVIVNRNSAEVLADTVGASLAFGTSRFAKQDRTSENKDREIGENAPDPYFGEVQPSEAVTSVESIDEGPLDLSELDSELQQTS